MAESVDHTGIMIRILQDLCGCLTAEEALHVIIEQLGNLLPHQSLAVILSDENTGLLAIKTSRQISYSFAKQFRREIAGQPILHALLKHETVLLNDAEPGDPDYRRVKLEHDFSHACLAPIIQSQRAIGYIHCDRAEGPAFTEADGRHLLLAAYLIGQQLQRFDLLFLTRHLVRVDEASKALKYHAFVDQFGHEIERARTYGTPLSLIFLHLNGYAAYVAAAGVDAGHALLARGHDLIRDCTRPIDLISRYSANELLVCLSGMGQGEAETVMAQVERQLARLSSAHKPPVRPCGVVMALERRSQFDLPLERLLSALGSGLLAARQRAHSPFIAISAPEA